MKTRILSVLVLAMFLLAGCGTTHKPAPVVHPPVAVSPVPGHPCTPSNYYMQCAAGAPGTAKPALSRPKGGGVFGIDFAWGGPSGSTARAFGAHYGISYLSGTSKDWSPGLLASYGRAGLGRVFVWEQSAGQAEAGCSVGRAAASAASGEAARLGYAGVPIYFAVDTDTTAGAVYSYFRCVEQTIGKARTGIYGGYYVVSGIWNSGVVGYVWQTLAWSRGLLSSHACLYQYAIERAWHGYNVDYNLAYCSNYGQYHPGPPPPPPDPFHRLWYPTGPFKSPYGKLNERLVVQQYDGARQHPAKYAKYLKHLEGELRYLAGRDSFVAHHPLSHGKPTWDQFHRGWRYQQLIHRAQGKKIL